ncbi:dynamin family protein [Halobacillus yeomjeoni]|uniref:Dynamin family protein n=1 Tax=Halobacillus yeomjeoni TaxID=311194 RepID=A0A931HTQ1_9BACI|nr:dynamin family protein [Halobacillus yeomjeoni]MBH0229492.1 dynamin family protein [Halobacillus yeomjeoni]
MSVITTTKADTLSPLYRYTKENISEKQSEKILDIIEKLNGKKMIVGFAGHFSAGKSTLINHLLGRDMLPSSPIPTSANIVQLKKGNPYTVTHMRGKAPVLYKGEIDFEQIKKMCKDGDEITRVEISRPDSGLPSHGSVLDTPGVDSTDDADRLITESSLHLMDYLYYVMDYNHVQSEVNLQFLLDMQERGTPFSIVINQVDKHNEEEIAYEEFQASVVESLKRWGITPENIYYTSMKQLHLPVNEFNRLKEDFQNLWKRSYETIEDQALRDVDAINKESVEILEENQEEEVQQLEGKLAQLEKVLDQKEVNNEDLLTTDEWVKGLKDDYEDRIRSFISNAYLMPSVLREDAAQFLEAQQPGFKVGLVFARKKTEEARQERARTFYSHLMESLEKNLMWPLRDRFLKLFEKYGVKDSELIQKVQAFHFSYDQDRLFDLIEPGASITGEYILRYTDQVSKDIQKEMRAFANSLLQDAEDSLRVQREAFNQENQSALHARTEWEEADQKLRRMEEQINEFRDQMEALLQKEPETTEKDLVHKDLEHRTERMIEEKEVKTESKEKVYSSTRENEDATPVEKESSSLDKALEDADETLSIIHDVNTITDLYDHLKMKKERLEQRHFTVALFGAFSAGKSSFANALLGEKVLPVSPNPTTATINKISPPTSDHPHRTIEVKLKTSAHMLEDMKGIFERLDVDVQTVEEGYQTAKELSKDVWKKLDQKQYSFLEAFLDGFMDMKDELGQNIFIEWEQFRSYVAEEKKSCFVETMELFYDCPFTRAGITLVDTPGTDSVNARHTNVSFEYIKDSDAVLFVTYYNHPFSKADQSFLTQLGRVKDSFSMDKMFFIINASDLAESEEELEFVKGYVQDQLLQFGIRHPRLYGASSLNALKEKQGLSVPPSGIQTFESDFENFLKEELAQVLIQSLNQDMDHIRLTLSTLIENSRLGEEERKNKLESLKSEQTKALKVFEQQNLTVDSKVIENKAEKQLHYAHERMMLNFNDLFKQHFNPATIKGQGEEVKERLRQAQKNLLDEVDHEMKQELRAISLRLERLIQQTMKQLETKLESELRKIQSGLHLYSKEWEGFDVPEFSMNVELKSSDLSRVLKTFKSTKAFFEKNEKEIMKDEMASILRPELQSRFKQAETQLNTYYGKAMNQIFNAYRDEWKQQTKQTFERWITNLQETKDTSEMEKAYKELEKRSS